MPADVWDWKAAAGQGPAAEADAAAAALSPAACEGALW